MGMPHVCVSVYCFQGGTADQTLRKARETAYPAYRQRPGFVAYELFQTGEDSGIGISTWETAPQAEAAAAADDQWITEHGFTTVSWVQAHLGRVHFSSRGEAAGVRA
jgi:hypothetical protein